MTDIILNRPNFLGSEVGLVTKTISVPANFDSPVVENGRKIVKAGTYISTPMKGFLFVDADITDGAAIRPLMIGGYYIDAKLPATAASVASDLAEQGLYAFAEGTVTRPDFGSASALSVLTEPTGTAVAGAISWTKINGATKYEVYVANEAGDKVYVADAAQAASPTYTVEANGSYYLKAIGDNVYSVDSKFSTAVVVSGLEG